MSYIKGFSLMELLIAISILVILLTLSFIAYQGLTKNSRDTKVKTDIFSIQQALEQYKADLKSYPQRTNGSCEAGKYAVNTSGVSCNISNADQTRIYLDRVPVASGGIEYTYYSWSPSFVCTNNVTQAEVTDKLNNNVSCNNLNPCTQYCLAYNVENSQNQSLDDKCTIQCPNWTQPLRVDTGYNFSRGAP